jgi:hypothetical protein
MAPSSKKLTDLQLCNALEELVRTFPENPDYPENLPWLGRATAIVEEWGNYSRVIEWNMAVRSYSDIYAVKENHTYILQRILHHALQSVSLRIDEPRAHFIAEKMPFDFFDKVREFIQTANSEVFFVDPYFDSDCVARYLKFVNETVSIRILGKNSIEKLEESIKMYKSQSSQDVKLRSSSKIHDRYIIIDGARCLMSGASLKDGGKKSGTALIPISNAAEIIEIYNKYWDNGNTRV